MDIILGRLFNSPGWFSFYYQACNILEGIHFLIPINDLVLPVYNLYTKRFIIIQAEICWNVAMAMAPGFCLSHLGRFWLRMWQKTLATINYNLLSSEVPCAYITPKFWPFLVHIVIKRKRCLTSVLVMSWRMLDLTCRL